MLKACDFMHSHNIVHRDFKPENVMLRSTASDSRIKVIDFELATSNVTLAGGKEWLN